LAADKQNFRVINNGEMASGAGFQGDVPVCIIFFTNLKEKIFCTFFDSFIEKIKVFS